MPPRKPTPADLLDLLIARAPALHAAGVTSVHLDGLSATLSAPPAAAAEDEPGEQPAPTHTDPMRDPSTYPGGRIPGFSRPKDGDS